MVEIFILLYNGLIFITLIWISATLNDIHETLKGKDDEEADDS